MPVGIWQVEWPNANSQRAYPLAAEATRRDVTGVFELPNSLLLGMVLAVNAEIDWHSSEFFISEIGSFPFGFHLRVGVMLGGHVRHLARTTVAYKQHTPPRTYHLVTHPGTHLVMPQFGRIVVGKVDDLRQQPEGIFRFDVSATRLEPDVIRPVLPSVHSLSITSGHQTIGNITGDVELVAGTNMRITVVENSHLHGRIRIDAIAGEGLNEECQCGEKGPPIRTIAGVSPDANGHFHLIGNECLQIQGEQYGLILSDKCAKPCCGCKEAEVVTAALETLRRQVSQMEKAIQRLETQMAAMDQAVLGSRFGDNGCVDCS